MDSAHHTSALGCSPTSQGLWEAPCRAQLCWQAPLPKDPGGIAMNGPNGATDTLPARLWGQVGQAEEEQG